MAAAGLRADMGSLISVTTERKRGANLSGKSFKRLSTRGSGGNKSEEGMGLPPLPGVKHSGHFLPVERRTFPKKSCTFIGSATPHSSPVPTSAVIMEVGSLDVVKVAVFNSPVCPVPRFVPAVFWDGTSSAGGCRCYKKTI